MEIGQQTESQERDQQPSTQQNQSELTVYPFSEVDGNWTISDAELNYVFMKMQDQKLVDMVFSQDRVENVYQFIALMKAKRNIVQFVWDGKDVIAVTWINSIGDNFAFGHFCVFKEAWGKRSEEIGALIKNYWFGLENNGKYVLDVIIGMMPTKNRIADNFVQRVGWIKIGVIPGMFRLMDGGRDDAVIYYTLRSDNG